MPPVPLSQSLPGCPLSAAHLSCPACSRAAGWSYSEQLVRVLDDYRRRFPWLWAAIEQDSTPGAPGWEPDVGGAPRWWAGSAVAATAAVAHFLYCFSPDLALMLLSPASSSLPPTTHQQARSGWTMCCRSSPRSSSWSRLQR